MAKQQFQFCTPLPKLQQQQQQQQQQPLSSSKTLKQAAVPTTEQARLCAGPPNSVVVLDAAPEQQPSPNGNNLPQPGGLGPQPAHQDMQLVAKSSSQAAPASSGHRYSSHPSMLACDSPEVSQRAVKVSREPSADLHGTCNVSPAAQPEASTRPDLNNGVAECQADIAAKTSLPGSRSLQAKQVNDAYDYAMSQAEGAANGQQSPAANTDARMDRSSARGTGRKQLPVWQAAAAKRQKQLPGTDPKAAKGRRGGRQTGRHMTRVVGAASQKMFVGKDAVSATPENPQPGSQEHQLQQQLMSQPPHKAPHQEASQQQQQQLHKQDLPKPMIAHQQQLVPQGHLPQQQQLQQPEQASKPTPAGIPAVMPTAPGSDWTSQAQVMLQLAHLQVNHSAPVGTNTLSYTVCIFLGCQCNGDILATSISMTVKVKVIDALQVVNVQSGKKVVVGSGLDRPKLDQIRRLCRRLRADACKTVDHHTTHLVVQVSLCSIRAYHVCDS